MRVTMMATSAVLAMAAPAAAQRANVQVEIMAAMTASAAAWNAGSLDRFMTIYAPDAIFVAGNSMMRTRAEIAAHYRPSFVGGSNSRGRLSFQPLAFKQLSAVHQVLYARWTLTPASGTPETGLTTLLFERRPEGWRIISDHS